MSAFIVEDKTINRITDYLRAETSQDSWFTREVLKFMGTQTWNDFAQEMLEMNIEAVDYRYNEENEKRKIIFYSGNYIGNKIQALKSLNCYLYQCSEGEVPNKPLYKFLETVVKVHLMSSIINDMPAYDNAAWA